MPRPPRTNADQPRPVRAQTTVPDPVTTPLLEVSTAHEYNLVPGMGRTAWYEAVKRGDLPSAARGAGPATIRGLNRDRARQISTSEARRSRRVGEASGALLRW